MRPSAIDQSRGLPSTLPSSSDESDLSEAFQHSLILAHAPLMTPTVASLRREAELRDRDAALRIREATVLQREAEQLRRDADALQRRRQAEDAEFELSLYQDDGAEFWKQYSQDPTDDETDASSSKLSSISVSASPSVSPSSSYVPSQPTISSPSTLSPQPARRPPPAPLTPIPAGDTRVYQISSPTKQGIVTSWATAGHHTLPYPGSQVKRLSKPSPIVHAPYRYHVIVKGTYPGVYEGHWYNFEQLVKHVPHSIHKGFNDLQDARAAYTIASALGFVQAIRARGAIDFGPSPGLSLVSTTPSQDDILAALSRAPTNFLGDTWYVVTKGIRPGVYPCWTAVADLVIGVSTAVYRTFSSHADAVAAYDAAVRRGEVFELRGDRSYVVG